MLLNSIVLNKNNNNNNSMMMTRQNVDFPFVMHSQQQSHNIVNSINQQNNYFMSLLLSETKTSLDEVQINSPLFLKLDIDDLLQTLQNMNSTQCEQQLPSTPSSTLNTSTNM